MPTWYRARFEEIAPIEVTDCGGGRVMDLNGHVLQDGNGTFYRPTREEAKAVMVAHHIQERDFAKANYEFYEGQLTKALEA